jgi:FixJ family two-component response regulator
MISIVDDDASICSSVKALLKSMGFEARTYASAVEFLSSATGLIETTCLIADIQMPNMSGLELCERLKRSGMDFPIVLMTAFLTEEIRQRAAKIGAACCLGKPFQPSQLLPWLEGSTEK